MHERTTRNEIVSIFIQCLKSMYIFRFVVVFAYGIHDIQCSKIHDKLDHGVKSKTKRQNEF